MMSVGEKLNELRIRKSKTLKEQSSIAGVSLNTVYRWEHNRAKPRKASLRKLASFYGVSFEWLANADNEEESAYAADFEPPVCPEENQLLKMYRELPNTSKYKILGYIERVYVEEVGKFIKAM